MTDTPQPSAGAAEAGPADGDPTDVRVAEPDADLVESHDADEAVRKARGDAAGYRRRLREAEAERDALAAERDVLAGRVQSRQRSDVETLASRQLLDGSDLWTALDLPDLLGDDGEVDEQKVDAAVEALLVAKPHYRRSGGDIGQGVRGTISDREPTFADVLRGA